jgi:hypothetical protein
MEKTCFKCGNSKPLTEFYGHKAMSAKVLGKCKDCTKQDVRNYRRDNIDKIREYDRQRADLPHRKSKRAELFKREWDTHPDRMKARNAVSNALRDKRLQKHPCAFCGCSGRVEAHHHDYAKPLDVTWLCTPCHRRFHALERMATYQVKHSPEPGVVIQLPIMGKVA